MSYIERHPSVPLAKTLVIMDNARYHTPKQTKEFLDSAPWTTLFLPAYSPSLAPVELYFASLKAKLKKPTQPNAITLDSQVGMKLMAK